MGASSLANMSDEQCVNAIRVLSAEVVQKAKSGHPGAPMGCAPIAHTLWSKVMKYSPADPTWINRDRCGVGNGGGPHKDSAVCFPGLCCPMVTPVHCST